MKKTEIPEIKLKPSECYLGNPLLKKEGVDIPFTPEMQLEYARCLEDKIYFIRNYCQIVTLDHGLQPFEMWDFQEEMIREFSHNRFVICKMPRQVGKTTTVAAFLLWEIIFNDSYNIAILANKAGGARDVLGRLQTMYMYLPVWLQMGVKEWNKGSLVLDNDSKIRADSTSSSAIRGGSYNMIYLDEFAFVPNNIQVEFMTSVYPTITSGSDTKILITSTPNGMNLFYKIWTDSEEGNNEYKRVSVHWSHIPGRDEAWKKQTIANTSEEQFRQEYEIGRAHV